MAETCAISFSYPTSCSTSIVLEGLWALPLPVLIMGKLVQLANGGFSSLIAHITEAFQHNLHNFSSIKSNIDSLQTLKNFKKVGLINLKTKWRQKLQ